MEECTRQVRQTAVHSASIVSRVRLPRGKKFLDACCGGGALLMAAAMSGRWEKVVGNDLNAATIALLDAVLIHKGLTKEVLAMRRREKEHAAVRQRMGMQ